MTFSAFDHRCMAEAITLARRGLMTTMPNPRVGCLLTQGESVVGRGWHRKAGGPHAEVAALEDARGAARGATAYVTLEPCSHEGRTGPCANALLEAGVTRVVVGSRDPNPRVDGGGLRELANAGILAESGLMESSTRALNPGFFSRMERGRPWVRVKLAQSLDGRTALPNGESQWITGPEARADVQHWRGRACAVLTGVETVIADDPSLNLRLAGIERQPLRVIADSRWRTPATSKTLDLEGEVLVAGLAELEPPSSLVDRAELLRLPGSHGRLALPELLEALAGREVNELHVEAGAVLSGALLHAGLVDEIVLYQAPCLLGENGRPGFVIGDLVRMEDRPEFEVLERVAVGSDLRMRLVPPYREV